MDTSETNFWTQLPKEKREKAATIMSEFSSMAVTWNEQEREKMNN
ncbi:hypothetical protein [Brevibacillus choshinensis]|nr:hypothetical protein [Brevibacillus choshinensis]MED4750570.1 hypothetical protein [Brevibacillus choshinensis]MED4779659.1 hypothetical protein [Brevibacillus choshinensis]